MDILERLTNGKTEFQRKAPQHERLINRDFPWLWAVRNKWLPGYGEIIVKPKGEPPPETFLTKVCSQSVEVWMRSTSGRLVEVKRVEIGENDTRCWAQSIIENVGIGIIVKDIVLITELQMPKEGKSFTIYRSKHWLGFNRVLTGLAYPSHRELSAI